jgi:hypothetical protein
MKAIYINDETGKEDTYVRGKGDSTTLSCGLRMGPGVDNNVIAVWMDEKKVGKCCHLWNLVWITS